MKEAVNCYLRVSSVKNSIHGTGLQAKQGMGKTKTLKIRGVLFYVGIKESCGLVYPLLVLTTTKRLFFVTLCF